MFGDEDMKWLICMIALFYLDTHQAQSVVASEEFGLPFSTVKLFKADTAMGQIMGLLFQCNHLTTRHFDYLFHQEQQKQKVRTHF